MDFAVAVGDYLIAQDALVCFRRPFADVMPLFAAAYSQKRRSIL